MKRPTLLALTGMATLALVLSGCNQLNPEKAVTGKWVARPASVAGQAGKIQEAAPNPQAGSMYAKLLAQTTLECRADKTFTLRLLGGQGIAMDGRWSLSPDKKSLLLNMEKANGRPVPASARGTANANWSCPLEDNYQHLTLGPPKSSASNQFNFQVGMEKSK